MKTKRIKQVWSLSKSVIILGLLFWLIETIYFLIAYGWHWKAINRQEQLCDDIGWWIFTIGFLLFISTVASVVEYLLTTEPSPHQFSRIDEYI